MGGLISRRTFTISGVSAAAIGVVGCTAETADDAGDGAGKDRTIGFDLWAGVPGAFGSLIDVTSGSRRIRGPLAWTHPVTGRRMEVYELINHEPTGVKRQLYTMTGDGSALGRVFDSRPGQADRVFVGDAFFPLGRWSHGERRSYPMQEIQSGETRDQIATIHIRRLSFEYRGVPGSLKYDWILTDAAGRKLFDERFIHSPGAGFVKFINRMA